ncbi:hypothetical protein [Catellatospora citrea]|uniref:LPXTG-motif cell wall-anchored protein n=1 Tax=Catellatospora citrea TaxID=53366 RepID=A0A8J3KFK2_9ACTN|nr:hypothetical protein [Catellatospora citrea]RKE10359.1 hypothetical protein C8E86_5254 [Catellatospora citrea]GIF99136.1 hypothetical protein Cci01nite_42300 [Catellatospora citrea]
MRLPIPRRLLAVGAVAAAAIALSPAPVHAEGYLWADLQDIILGANGAPGKVFHLGVAADGAVNGKVTIDFSSLDGIAAPTFPGMDVKCAVTGSTGVCDLPDGGFSGTIPVRLVPGAGATEGVKAEITVTATADGAESVTDTAEVTVASGADIVVLGKDWEQKPKIGDKVNVPVNLVNAGDKAAPSLDLFFSFSHGIKPAQYDNCLYAPWDELGGTYVLCTIAKPVEPGAEYSVPGGFQATVADDTATAERGSMSVDIGTETPSELRRQLGFQKAASGTELTLVEAPAARSRALVAEIDAQDNWADMTWLVATGNDLAAKGAELTGAVGDKVTVDLGVTNNGPASNNGLGRGDGAVEYGVTVPEWAKAVRVPSRCVALVKLADGTFDVLGWGEAGHRYYRCLPEALFHGVGETITVPFTFEIVATSGADGAVDLTAADMTEPHTDLNNANNTAKITLAAGGTGGGLPVTGVQVGLVAGVGGALVALGVVLFVVARRRRMPIGLS